MGFWSKICPCFKVINKEIDNLDEDETVVTVRKRSPLNEPLIHSPQDVSLNLSTNSNIAKNLTKQAMSIDSHSLRINEIKKLLLNDKQIDNEKIQEEFNKTIKQIRDTNKENKNQLENTLTSADKAYYNLAVAADTGGYVSEKDYVSISNMKNKALALVQQDDKLQFNLDKLAQCFDDQSKYNQKLLRELRYMDIFADNFTPVFKRVCDGGNQLGRAMDFYKMHLKQKLGYVPLCIDDPDNESNMQPTGQLNEYPSPDADYR